MRKAEYKNARESRKKISSAYLKLLVERGTKFSVTDLVSLAGINRGTFYLHFKNLDDVARFIQDELAENFKKLELDFRQVEIDQFPEEIVKKFNVILLKDLDYYRLLMSAGDNFGLFNKIKTSVMNIVSNNFKLMRYVSNYDRFKVAVQYVAGGALTVYTEWFKGEINCTIDKLSDWLSTIIRGGLKGYIRY